MDDKNRIDESRPAETERRGDVQTGEQEAHPRRRLNVKTDVHAGDGTDFVRGGGSDYP